MTKSFLAIGECMIELADAGNGLYRRGFAGDTFNTAWYARRLLPENYTVAYGSCIGSDAVSDEMADFIAGEGIDTSTLRRIADRTVGLYMISLTDGERSFSYWRSSSAAKLLAADPDWLASILEGRKIVHFSGITLAILSPEHRQVLADALDTARARGTLVAFDTNLRPRLWGSAAEMREGITLGASVADVVLPSFDEETGLFGDPTPQDTAMRYRMEGANTVAVKNGGGDLTLWDTAGGLRSIRAVRVDDVVDTTAAGDSFGAAFLAGIAQGQTPDAAARAAMVLAAKVIQSRGALVPGIFEGGDT